MADSSPLNPPDSRPLLAFGPAAVGPIPKARGRLFRSPRVPSATRQSERLTPQFETLQRALAGEAGKLTDAIDASNPEHHVVFEVIGTVAGFINAVRRIEGLHFVDDLVGEDVDPDEDFYYEDEDGHTTSDQLPQTLYLVMTNARAVQELVNLFERYRVDQKVQFPQGLAPFKKVFELLHTVRRWGSEDRVAETGLLEQWREDIEVVGDAASSVRVEIELVWRTSIEARNEAQSRVEQILEDTLGAEFITSGAIESIQYHAVLADLPRSQVDVVLRDGPGGIVLLCCEDILFVAPFVPMSFVATDSDEGGVAVDPTLPQGAPIVALFDGLPLANHDVLDGRLLIDDPEDRGADYSPAQCTHGTGMASLIIHGDLNQPGPPLSTPLYVHPVLAPDRFQQDWETMPRDRLFVDVIHAAFQRLVANDETVKQSVGIVNLSIGEPARVFIRRMSPLARLVDYLMVTHNILVIVSAGNHPLVPSHRAGTKLRVSASALAGSPNGLDSAVRNALHQTARQRGLLAPAEAVNALTVGAVHADESNVVVPDTAIDPQVGGSIALYSPVGFGFRRSPKPDLHAPGGRTLILRPHTDGLNGDDLVLEAARTAARGPGIRVAAPGDGLGARNFAYTCGTSNAAALTTRAAAQVEERLRTLSDQEGQLDCPPPEYHPVLIKTLLVHAASWPQEALNWAGQLGIDGRRKRRELTRMLGFGALNLDRVGNATSKRACVVGVGAVGKDRRHSFRFPLPPSLSDFVGWRRLTITLAWFSPIMPRTQQYRVAHLAFSTPLDKLRVKRTQVDHHANGKGTVLHEVLEGTHAAGYAADGELSIDVDCRVRVGKLDEPVRFGLAATLEVGQEVLIDVHDEVRQRLREQAQAARVRTKARR